VQTSRVFVSHTSDLAGFPAGRSFVQAVLDAVARAGMVAVDMRYFAAREGQPADYCQQHVRQCDIYAAVVGWRYGSLVPTETVSYTELEFTQHAAAVAARRLADPTAQARAHRSLALAYTRLGRFEEAHTQLRHALNLVAQAGDLAGQAHTHTTLAWVWERQDHHAEALDHARQALDLYTSAFQVLDCVDMR
jgi:tetratricopeptide (TPR) repeat protein